MNSWFLESKSNSYIVYTSKIDNLMGANDKALLCLDVNVHGSKSIRIIIYSPISRLKVRFDG